MHLENIEGRLEGY